MINWKVRIKNKLWWLAVVPAVLLVAQAVAGVFGFRLDFGTLHGDLIAVIEAVFALLALMGVVVDPTTQGIADSTQAMTYEQPKEGE